MRHSTVHSILCKDHSMLEFKDFPHEWVVYLKVTLINHALNLHITKLIRANLYQELRELKPTALLYQADWKRCCRSYCGPTVVLCCPLQWYKLSSEKIEDLKTSIYLTKNFLSQITMDDSPADFDPFVISPLLKMLQKIWRLLLPTV